MAEARLEEEEESRELREPTVLRSRRGQSSAATERSERNKPEHRLSSQGPLSSLRAAIKRTSRSGSQSDHSRDRRRPEITIVSAEPLAANPWFPGGSGGFPSAPPPAQPLWGGNIPAAAQPPPSYDQVIKEKTKEQAPAQPAATPRHSTTIATQTDFLPDTATTDPEFSAAPQSIERKESVRRPPKPPRPSLPSKPKPEPDATNAALVVDQACLIPDKTLSSVSGYQAAEAELCPADPCSVTPGDPSPLCEDPAESFTHRHVSVDCPTPVPEADSALLPTEHPTPRPRSKLNRPLTSREVKVQTLVRIKDDGDIPQLVPTQGEGLPSGKYLQELLDIFGDDQSCQGDHQSDPASEYTGPSEASDQSEEDDGGSMSVSDNQRNIKAKIQAFEKQGSIDLIDEAPLVKPEPRPRTSQNKPPPAVAAKPSFSRRPTGLWEPLPGMGAGIEFNRKETQSPPTPRPRPMVPRALSESEAGDAVPAKVDKVPLLPPSRPSVMPRSRTLTAQEEVAAITPPIPPPKIKPAADPPALNNHNPPPTPPTKPAMENGNTGRSHSNAPIKPQRSLNSAPNPPSVARKPTMIRVPSRVEKSPENEALDPPPPLPVQKPIGGVPLPITRKPTLISRPTYPPPPVENSKPEGFGSAVPEISLPPRLSGGKVLPPRPPPAKGGPGRPPPPRAEVAPIAVPTQLGRVAVLPKRLQSHKGAPKKGPVLPPRPNPGHPLYNTYTLGIPHAIAEFDYNGSNTAELSFQKNEVLVLLEQMDNNTFECQVGDTKGPVHKSYLKIITPLSSVPSRSSPQPPRSELPRRGSSGLQVQALHDFTPEGPEELALRAGDLVCMVERVDSEWYHGTCRGASGIFPISFVRVLSTIPAPPNGQKAPPAPATVSGPRCVARFDFEGEHSDELTFAEGDVISLKEYVGEEWARGQFNGYIGIFPLDFVEIVEDLPAPPPQAQHGAQPAMPAQHTMLPPAQHAIQPPPEHTIQLPAHQSMLPLAQHTMPSPAQHAIQLPAQHTMPPSAQRTAQIRIPLPGMVPISQKQQAAKPSQSHSRPPGAEWGLAMYDFTAETEEDLSFQEGAVILITEHVDSEWCRGRLDGKEGYFPAAFVEPCEAPMEEPESPKTEGEGRGRALYDFVSECEDELSLKVGDIITGLESIDDEWFFGELNGTRGLVPKNYVQVL